MSGLSGALRNGVILNERQRRLCPATKPEHGRDSDPEEESTAETTRISVINCRAYSCHSALVDTNKYHKHGQASAKAKAIVERQGQIRAPHFPTGIETPGALTILGQVVRGVRALICIVSLG